MSSLSNTFGDKQVTLDNLELQIGRKADGLDPMSVVEAREVKPLLVAWLTLHDIPKKQIETAGLHRMAQAYANWHELKRWQDETKNLGRGSPQRNQASSPPRSASISLAESLRLADLKRSLEAETALTPPPTPQASGTPPAKTQSADPETLWPLLRPKVQGEIRGEVRDLRSETQRGLVQVASELRADVQNLIDETLEKLLPPRVIQIQDLARGTTEDLGLQHENFPRLFKAVSARNHKGYRLNIWLSGPTGSGKTSAAESVAKALRSEFARNDDEQVRELTGLTTIGGDTSLDHFAADGSLDQDFKITGFRDGNGKFHWTNFLRIFAYGGVYCADEVDNWLPSALLSLNSALANGFIATAMGMIPRHPNCCIIACANTWGLGANSKYVGRNRLDAASLDRFMPKMEWNYDEKLESAIAHNMAGDLGTRWAQSIQKIRQRIFAQGLEIIASPRATFDGIALLQAGFSEIEVQDMTIGAGLSLVQKQAIGLGGVL